MTPINVEQTNVNDDVVTVVNVLKKDLDKVQHRIQKLGKKCHSIACDVTNHLEVEKLFRRIKKLDILVNNAGTNRPEHFTKVKKIE